MLSNCTHEGAWHRWFVYNAETQATEGLCNQCGLEGAGEGIPDVYLERTGQKFANLCDKMGRPIEIRSKRHKKQVMDALGVSEAGDRKHGAFEGPKSWIEGTREYRRKQFEKDRPVIRETYRRYLDNVRSRRP